jgi:N-methylhydantoinase A/oxoprolinase/acetone carboxylase beta subunit
MEENNRKCLTSGMVWSAKINEECVDIRIAMPVQKWNEAVRKEIKNRLHDGIEYALAPYWTEGIALMECGKCGKPYPIETSVHPNFCDKCYA